MKKCGIFVLVCALLLAMPACSGKKASSKGISSAETTLPTEPIPMEIPVEYQFLLMMNGQYFGNEPNVWVISSQAELQSLYNETQWTYCANDCDWTPLDIGEVFAAYDTEYFEDMYLILMVFTTGTFDLVHEIPQVLHGPDGQMHITVNNISEYGFTDCSGSWCGILEVDKTYQTDAKNIHVVLERLDYPNGRPADS